RSPAVWVPRRRGPCRVRLRQFHRPPAHARGRAGHLRRDWRHGGALARLRLGPDLDRWRAAVWACGGAVPAGDGYRCVLTFSARALVKPMVAAISSVGASRMALTE